VVDASGEVNDHERIVDERELVDDGFCGLALDSFEVVLLNQLVMRPEEKEYGMTHFVRGNEEIKKLVQHMLFFDLLAGCKAGED
jgi:hypothetical protein